MLPLPVLEDISQLLCNDQHSDAIIKAAKELLSDEPTPKMRKILSDLLLNLEDRSDLETREEDKDWFQGRRSRGGRDDCARPRALLFSHQKAFKILFGGGVL